MALRFRGRAAASVVALVAIAGTASAEAPFLAPDAALCFQHLREGERARAEAVLGPLEALPLYRVTLEVDPSQRTVEGELELTQWVGERVINELTFQLTPNAQRSGQVRVTGAVVNGRAAQISGSDSVRVRVAIEPMAPAHSTLRVRLTFRARVPPISADPLGGMMSVSEGKREATDYGAFGASGRALSLIGVIPHVVPMRPDGSLRPGPSGMGDLALYDPAHLLLNVRVPRGYEAQGTGLELGVSPSEDGLRYTFAAGVVRDFPVFVTRGYEHRERQHGDVKLSVHFSPAHAAAAERALEYAEASLAEMEQRLGPYPFNRLRVIEAPLQAGAGGMEFPGLISVSANLLSGGLAMLDGMGIPPDLKPMVKQLLASTSSLESVVENTLEFTVAHEVAHQYFALLVASDPVTEPAVDETLAQYTALLYLEWRHGKDAAEAMRTGQVAASYQLFRMMGGEDGKVDRPTSAFGSGLEYAALVYGKGPLLHEAERKLLGDAAFVSGLRRYVDDYRYRWACRDCLTRSLSKEVPSQASALVKLRQRWWEEAHGDEDLGTPESPLPGTAGPKIDAKTQDLMDEVMRAFQ